MEKINDLAHRVNNIAFDLGESPPFKPVTSKSEDRLTTFQYEVDVAALDRLIQRFEEIAHQVGRRQIAVGIGQLKMF